MRLFYTRTFNEWEFPQVSTIMYVQQSIDKWGKEEAVKFFIELGEIKPLDHTELEKKLYA